ncbi:FtsX-like permease family protein [Kitasatospora cineracea]|uniref:FtsX-like permease family protein n=1 Tax=Kitasatospora cineracea TaxID=88074 RepID=A0A3N4RVR0_9ACTN|nr:FtsX-like permease family protein [Kitasatospora cineracea]RPE37036.1 FtsX-like permease family protein [Kitasatospora cineracea]
MIGFVVRRLRGRLPLAAAALLTVLITTSVLTALVAFDRGAAEAGLRRALQGTGAARAAVLVGGDRAVADRAGDDAAVAGFARGLFGALPTTVESVARSRSYGLPGSADRPDLTVLAALDRSRTALLSGTWPAAPAPTPSPAPASASTAAPVQAAVPQNALAGLGLDAAALPARLELTDRFTNRRLTVEVTGVYRAADPSDPYWRTDPAAGRGVQVLAYTTYGPLLVDDAVFTSGAVAQAGRSWLVRADFAGLTPGAAAALRARVAPAGAALERDAALTADTGLDALLGELASDAQVARSTLLVGALQLAVLAGAALLLVVHLLADRQAAENRLLAARGASRGRVGVFATGEAVLLAVPAALLAPLLVPWLVRLLAATGPLAGAGLAGSLPWVVWPVAAACALGCVLLTALPSPARSAGAALLRRAGRRQARVSSVVRSGADVALLALAVVAYRQLARYSGVSHGVDPLLVVAPTLALCAGTVLVLRVLPLVSRLGDRWAARSTGLGPALAGWQLARRPARAAGPVLLLVLAVAVGMLAIGQRASWSQSQRDQASFLTAGGLRITGSALPAAGQGGVYAALPGGERIVPVARRDVPLPQGAAATVLLLDAVRAAAHLPVRSDLLGGRSAGEVFGPLAAAPVDGPALPERVELDVAADGAPGLSLLVRDRFGLVYPVPAAAPLAGGPQHLVVDLAAGGPNGRLAGPLTLAGLAVDAPGGAGSLTVDRLAAGDAPAADWSLTGGAAGSASTGASAPNGGSASTGASVSNGAGHLPTVSWPASPAGARHLVLAPGGRAAAPALSAVATESYLAVVGARVGQEVPVPFGTATLRARVTAAVTALPATGGPAVALDLAAVDRQLDARGEPAVSPSEWWLPAAGAGDDAPRRAAAELRAAPFAQQVLERDALAAQLRGDPLGAAPQSALAALAVAAVLLAAIGFAASAAGAAAERSREFAVLAALGAPRRRLLRTVAAEQGVLAVLGVGTGLLLGALLVHLVVPLVVLTPAAARPLPAVLVRLPPGQVAALAVVTAAALLVPALLVGWRGRDLTARLRNVEEM